MTRRLIIGWGALFVVTLIFSAIARMPLSAVIALSGAHLQAEQVKGTIWNGTITNLWVEGYPLGTVQVSARAVPLLTGQLLADVRLEGPIAQARGVVGAGLGWIGVQDAQVQVRIDPLDFNDALGQPMRGRINAQLSDVKVRGDQCVRGRVRVSTDTLIYTAQRYGGEGFVLQGTGTCAEGGLDLPLAGDGPDGTATAMIRIARQGYTTELVVTPQSRALADALGVFGFTYGADGDYRLIQRGEIAL